MLYVVCNQCQHIPHMLARVTILSCDVFNCVQITLYIFYKFLTVRFTRFQLLGIIVAAIINLFNVLSLVQYCHNISTNCYTKRLNPTKNTEF